MESRWKTQPTTPTWPQFKNLVGTNEYNLFSFIFKTAQFWVLCYRFSFYNICLNICFTVGNDTIFHDCPTGVLSEYVSACISF